MRTKHGGERSRPREYLNDCWTAGWQVSYTPFCRGGGDRVQFFVGPEGRRLGVQRAGTSLSRGQTQETGQTVKQKRRDSSAAGSRLNDVWDLRLDTRIREHVAFVMELCGGNRSEAAELLGMHRRTLQRLLQRFARTSKPKKRPPARPTRRAAPRRRSPRR